MKSKKKKIFTNNLWLKDYWALTKPGIIKGNLLTCLAGFMLASNRSIDFWVLAWTMFGTILVIAGGCVLNNVLDAEYDAQMARTKNRATVTGKITKIQANIFGFAISVIGLICLINFVNAKTAVVGLIGWVFYVYVYALAKRKTIYSTLVGGIAGATPPMAGYVAVENIIDTTSLVLFLILTCWQIPHFYAISIFRLDDYKRTKLPIFAVKKGILATKKQIILFCTIFLLVYPMLTFIGKTGWTYLAVMGLMSLIWLNEALRGISVTNNQDWARSVFLFSIKLMSIFCILLAFNGWLP